jgi:hypothetical protein
MSGRIGRPPKNDADRKAAHLSIRMSAKLRELLEAAADGERSLSQEIELRLRQSFTAVEETERRFGGPGTTSFLEIIANCIEEIEFACGSEHHWFDNQFMRDQVSALVNVILDHLKPRQRAVPRQLRLWADQSIINNLGRDQGLRVLSEIKEEFAAASKRRTLDELPPVLIRHAATPLGRRIRGSVRQKWLRISAASVLKQFPELRRIRDVEDEPRRGQAPRTRGRRKPGQSTKPKGRPK